jgi:CDK-activating kinase assembly factor MAT1
MNRREDDFEDLRSYNDYLEEVENLTFNLIYKIDVAETKRKLAEYAEHHKAEITRNAELESAGKQSFQALQAAQSEQARLRREAARREYEEERRELEQGRKEMIDKLARGEGDADKIARDAQRVRLKQSSARRANEQRLREKQSAMLDAQSSSFVIKGLKAPRRPASPVKPYSPFGGWNNPPNYYILQESYPAPHLDAAKKDARMLAGGYDIKDYYRRGLTEAFSGLAVFVEEEIGERERRKEEGTVAARDAATGSDADGFD